MQETQTPKVNLLTLKDFIAETNENLDKTFTFFYKKHPVLYTYLLITVMHIKPDAFFSYATSLLF